MKFKELKRRSVLQGMGAVGLVTAAGTRAFAQGMKWNFTIYYGPGHSLTELYTKLADDIRERTNGELDITVRTAGEMPFSATEAVPVLGQGQVDMALAYQGFIAGTTKVAALPGLPFLMRNAEEATSAMEVLAPHINAKLNAQGCEMLLWSGQNWPQNAYGRGEPMQRLEDFKGRNARGSSPEQGDIIREYGGAAVTLTTAEVPEAMHRGVVDAVFTGAANITGSKWTEFLDWGYFCDPHTGIEYVLINQELYGGLPDDFRAAVDGAVADAQTSIAAARKKSNDEAEAEMRETMTIVEADPEDVARYENQWAGYWDTWAESGGDEVVQALADVREKLGK